MTTQTVSYVIGGLCYVYIYDWRSKFNYGYDLCSLRRTFFSVPFDYGRLATFETPAYYDSTMRNLRSHGVTSYVMIGAFNNGAGGANLAEFYWGNSNSSDPMCWIFCDQALSVTCNTNPPSADAYIQANPAGGVSPRLLMGNPNNSFAFASYGDGATSFPFVCEFGKYRWATVD